MKGRQDSQVGWGGAWGLGSGPGPFLAVCLAILALLGGRKMAALAIPSKRRVSPTDRAPSATPGPDPSHRPLASGG